MANKIRKKTLANRLTALETYPKSENWGATVEKFKELENRDATARQQINALLARIEGLENKAVEIEGLENKAAVYQKQIRALLIRVMTLEEQYRALEKQVPKPPDQEPQWPERKLLTKAQVAREARKVMRRGKNSRS